MRPFRGSRWVCALVLAGLSSASAHAGWDNVFQVTCWGCKQKPAVSGYGCPTTACAPPCAPPPCQQTCCTTQYVQRSYYQPVTCYQTKVSYEPVTSYRTSYYYEPVTSYSYSCYYDPCSCSYQQVACPQTCYRLRSQTCAVTSYLQRTCQVPVTSYQLSYYYEPVTTCTQTPCCSPCSSSAPAVVEQQPAAVAVPAVPAVPATPTTPPPPAVKEQPSIPPTGAATPSTPDVQRLYPSNPATPAQPQGSYRPAPASAAPASAPQAPPVVKLDRIVSIPANSTANRLQGSVVQRDEKPRPGAYLLFVNERKQGTQQPVTADKVGRFNVELASGAWLVYVAGSDGRLLYHSKVEVRDDNNKPVMLVSR